MLSIILLSYIWCKRVGFSPDKPTLLSKMAGLSVGKMAVFPTVLPTLFPTLFPSLFSAVSNGSAHWPMRYSVRLPRPGLEMKSTSPAAFRRLRAFRTACLSDTPRRDISRPVSSLTRPSHFWLLAKSSNRKNSLVSLPENPHSRSSFQKRFMSPR